MRNSDKRLPIRPKPERRKYQSTIKLFISFISAISLLKKLANFYYLNHPFFFFFFFLMWSPLVRRHLLDLLRSVFQSSFTHYQQITSYIQDLFLSHAGIRSTVHKERVHIQNDTDALAN